jgi:hypothetical protein
MNIERKSYITGHKTPLLRGIGAFFFCSYLITYGLKLLKYFNLTAIGGYILLLLGHLASVIYHCIYMPKYELFFRKIDLIMVQTHPTALYLFGSNYSFGLFCQLLLIAYASHKLLTCDKYMYSFTYFSIFIINVIIVIYDLVVNNSFTLFQIFTVGLFSLLGSICFMHNTFNVINDAKIWGYHEWFHLFIILADLLTIYYAIKKID